MKYLTIDNMTITPEFVEDMRNWLILHRNEMLNSENPGRAFQLSLVIALLADYKRKINDSNT